MTRLRTLALTFVLSSLSACIAATETIRGKSNSAFLPAARLTTSLGGDQPVAAKSVVDAAGAAKSGHHEVEMLLDFEISTGSGGFTQKVDSSSSISLGGPSFNGNVAVDFDLSMASLVVRVANRFANGFGWDGFFGLNASELYLSLSEGGVTDSIEHQAYGPIVGTTISYRASEKLRFFVEGSYSTGIGEGSTTVGISSFQLGANMALGQHAQLSAGWRNLAYAGYVEGEYSSDVDLHLSGPMLALWLSL